MADVTTRLQSTIAAVCPIDGVGIGTRGDSASCRIDFTAAASPAQRTAAQAALTAFDWSDAAQKAWETVQDDLRLPERKAMRDKASQFITDCNTYAALASPTTAQDRAFNKKVAQMFPAIINWLSKVSG